MTRETPGTVRVTDQADATAGKGRTRAFSWPDPREALERAKGMSGLDLLRTLTGDGKVPVSCCLGFWLAEAEAGRVVFELEPAEYHYNPMGTVHGGILATVLDSAAGACVHSLLPPGASYTTLEIKVNFLRAVTKATGRLRCEGTVISQGSRVAVSQARLADRDGKEYAVATATSLVIRPETR